MSTSSAPADLDAIRRELAENPEYEGSELQAIYEQRGLDANLAARVAEQLTARDALAAHARDELGLSDSQGARPVQAALASAGSFAVGASLPLAAAIMVPNGTVIVGVAAASLLLLALLGGLASYAGGAPIMRGSLRVAFWGLLAMGLTIGVGRLVGFLGADALGVVGALADIGWLALLAAYVAWTSWARRTDRLLAFLYWIGALLCCLVAVRYGFLVGDVTFAQWMLHCAGFVFLGLLGVALARITVPVTNQVLDPSEETSPFRPHPGRVTLAPGLVAILIGGEFLGFSAEVTGYLAIAAGAAFMDRAGEAFVGREAARTELMALAGSAILAGAGLILTGAARLGAPLPEVAMLHLSLMGGLGTGVLMVLSIAGLLHSGRPLGFPLLTRLGFVLLVVAVALRILPDLGVLPDLPGPLYGATAIFWAAAFGLWLRDYWPFVSSLERP